MMMMLQRRGRGERGQRRLDEDVAVGRLERRVPVVDILELVVVVVVIVFVVFVVFVVGVVVIICVWRRSHLAVLDVDKRCRRRVLVALDQTIAHSVRRRRRWRRRQFDCNYTVR